jgi:hypothetical protein
MSEETNTTFVKSIEREREREREKERKEKQKREDVVKVEDLEKKRVIPLEQRIGVFHRRH